MKKYVTDLMVELETIQTQEKLNDVFSVDEIGPGNAHHAYVIKSKDPEANVEVLIEYQKGPRAEKDSVHGILDCDLLEIIKNRLEGFQSGPYSSEYNKHALFHVTKALEAMNKRVEDRIARNVLGKNEK